jgi:hypothetical protein
MFFASSIDISFVFGIRLFRRRLPFAAQAIDNAARPGFGQAARIGKAMPAQNDF